MPLPRFAATGTIFSTAVGGCGFGAGVGAGGTGVGGTAVGGTEVGCAGAGVFAAAAGWVGAVVGAGVAESHATTNIATTSRANKTLLKLIVVYLLLKGASSWIEAAPGLPGNLHLLVRRKVRQTTSSAR